MSIKEYVPMRSRLALLAGAGLMAGGLLAVAGCSAGSTPASNSGAAVVDVQTAASLFAGVQLGKPLAKPDLTLTDTGGRPYNLAAGTAGRLTLVYFGYTHCPDVCPTTMATLAAALRQLPAAQRERVDVVFVTTDPSRDTPAVERAWLNQFDPSFIGLTGPFAPIQQAAAEVGITIEPPVALPGGGYTVTHGAEVLAFNTDGKAHVVYTAGVTVAQFDHDIPLLLAHRDGSGA
jgi:protein SCO1/2